MSDLIYREHEMHAILTKNATEMWLDDNMTTEEYLKELKELDRIYNARLERLKED